MESKIASAIKMRVQPVGVYRTSFAPENAIKFKSGVWGCVVSLICAASKGKTAICSKDTVVCKGGRAGLGIEPYKLGVIEYFLSNGEKGERAGEFYKKTPELASEYVNSLPNWRTDEYIVFQPLNLIDEGMVLDGIIFLCNADQLSALTTLANYDQSTQDNVQIVFGSGCAQSIIFPFGNNEEKCYIGLTDPSARKYIDKDVLSFSIPYSRFLKMEKEVNESFLTKETWMTIAKRI